LTSRKPHLVLLAAAGLIAVVLGFFAVALFDGRADRRRAAGERFGDEARVSAALIESIFSSSADQVAADNVQRFGGATIDKAELETLVEKTKLSYAVVLDAEGNPIAATDNAGPSVLGALDEGPEHVTRVLQGEPWGLSGLTKGKTAEYASRFESSRGTRVLVQGFPVGLISGFVGGTLAKLPNAAREHAYVTDGTGRVISSAEPDVKVAAPAPPLGDDRTGTQAGIGGSEWKVVLSQRSADLYRGLGATTQWLVLAALALAGGMALLLLRRAMRQAATLESAFATLEVAHADLERTNAELARSNGELDQFASVASHDLQEPLRKVQAFGDRLERRFGHELDDEARDYLRRMRDAGARMSVLIDDLLRFSRVTTRAKPHVTVDLDRVVREVLLDLGSLVDETGGTVELDRLPAVTADPTQMRQLLQNLIANGLKFHRPDAPPVVRVRSAPAPAPGAVAFQVLDNGIGFESAHEERIFRVFERLHPRDVYAGTGIGLALCRKIAERHGGSIAGEGRPDEGATFTVVLPAAVDEGRSSEPASTPEPMPA